MANIDVILESPQIAVLGGPPEINVQLNTGATGQRGSLVYVGAGLPSSSTIPVGTTILPGDLYINIAEGQTNLWLYQYIVKPTGNDWQAISSIGTAPFGKTYEINYGSTTAGEGTVIIPISDIINTSASISANNFSVTFSFQHSNPIAASLKSKTISGSTNLELLFTAREYSGGSWIPYVNATAKIAVMIKVVA